MHHQSHQHSASCDRWEKKNIPEYQILDKQSGINDEKGSIGKADTDHSPDDGHHVCNEVLIG